MKTIVINKSDKKVAEFKIQDNRLYIKTNFNHWFQISGETILPLEKLKYILDLNKER